jgi:hypothetical protein
VRRKRQGERRERRMDDGRVERLREGTEAVLNDVSIASIAVWSVCEIEREAAEGEKISEMGRRRGGPGRTVGRPLLPSRHLQSIYTSSSRVRSRANEANAVKRGFDLNHHSCSLQLSREGQSNSMDTSARSTVAPHEAAPLLEASSSFFRLDSSSSAEEAMAVEKGVGSTG